MSDTQWSRFAGSAGIAFAVVLFVSTFIGGTIPPPTRAVATIVRHYVDNRGALLFQAWLGGLAAGILFPPFLIGFVRVLRRSEGGDAPAATLALTAGILVMVCALIGAAIEGSTAYLVVRSSDPAVIQALNDTSRFVLTFIWFPIALLTGTAGFVEQRTAVLPRGHAWASGFVGLLTLVASLAVFSLRDPIRPGGGLTILTFFVFLLWVVATSTVLWQEAASPPRQVALRPDVAGP
jgi:phosphoglycerol transferase MdoB-like AlkP superfamily enzyme